jgi:hypothetical protein
MNINNKKLHNVLMESIDKVLIKEESEGMGYLQEALKSLRELTHSGYIPFSSPSPSSTEMIIKKNVMQAIDLISRAIVADNQLYGKR